jgi:GNAT superfamily N-acetyltransferase
MFEILPFEASRRDDAIFCLLSAKNHLGRIPTLNEDLLDVQKSYFDKGDMFWHAISDANRVIGMLGTNSVSLSDMWLKRLYILPSFKRKGIASALLTTAETFARSKKITTIHTRFADDYQEALLFYSAKGFQPCEHIDGLHYFVKILA